MHGTIFWVRRESCLFRLFSYMLNLSFMGKEALVAEKKENLHPLVAFTGETGAGKTRHMKELVLRHADHFQVVPSITTRGKKPTESLEDFSFFYHQLSFEEFEVEKKEKKFIETDEYGESWYGTHAEILKQVLRSKIGVIALTPKGINAVKAAEIRVITIRIIAVGKPFIEIPMERKLSDISQYFLVKPDLTIHNNFTDDGLGFKRSFRYLELILIPSLVRA